MVAMREPKPVVPEWVWVTIALVWVVGCGLLFTGLYIALMLGRLPLWN